MSKRPILLSLLILSWIAAPTMGKTTLDVDLGWGGIFKAGRWSPIYITVSDSTPRAARLIVHISHDPIHGMRILQSITLNPQPATYAIFVPMQSWGTDLSIQIREDRNGQSGRLLADWNPMQSGWSQPYMPAEQIIGISGSPGGQRLLCSQLTSEVTQAPWIDTLRLPAAAAGYDGLNALVLNQPDLAQMSVEQQDAIIDWIRAGGHLLLWLGEQPPPASSPILDALPAAIGEVIAAQPTDSALAAAGLPDRFRNLKGRRLSPYPGSAEFSVLGISGYRRTLGLGRISLLPIDASTLLFGSLEASHAFWTPILGQSVTFAKPDPNNPMLNRDNIESQRNAEAAQQAMEMLGDVPGAGQFGFGYVTLVMLGMMLLVGPIDWIVLKRLGRQPWTWLTTSGWIAVVTIGAVYIGYIFKSGDLHYRTLSLVDQTEGACVARIDVAGIYSPRSGEYSLQTEPHGWWEPLSPAMMYGYSGRAMTDISFHQDYQGNRPFPMSIAVWNMRFLVGQSIEPAPPYIEASLQRINRNGPDRLVGTIKNVSQSPLIGFSFRVNGGRGIISGETLAPGATLSVNTAISWQPKPDPQDPRTLNYYMRPPTVGPEVLFDLALARSLRIERLLESGSPVICIFTQVQDAPAAVSLTPAPAIERHQRYIRAVLPLEASNP